MLTDCDKLAKAPRESGAAEWDWFFGLAPSEQTYLRRWYMVPNGPEPDVVADRYGAGTVDEGMELWLADVRYERSRRPSNLRDEWAEPELPEDGNLRTVLDIVRGQTNATDEEWARVEDAIAVRLTANCQQVLVLDSDLADMLPMLREEWGSVAGFPSFVGSRGVAELFGVAEVTTRMWKKRGKMPPPDEIIDGTYSAWSRGTIKKWVKEIQAYAAAVS